MFRGAFVVDGPSMTVHRSYYSSGMCGCHQRSGRPRYVHEILYKLAAYDSYAGWTMSTAGAGRFDSNTGFPTKNSLVVSMQNLAKQQMHMVTGCPVAPRRGSSDGQAAPRRPSD
jgi:hypothetical protein